tara:strand:+ start:560 stop:931 length:372 start_codon:yes stop_codon:yes gene_type:complete
MTNVSNLVKTLKLELSTFKASFLNNHLEVTEKSFGKSRDSIHLAHRLKAAESDFNIKVEKIAKTISKKGLNVESLNIERINLSSQDVEFYMTSEDSVLHARVIYVYSTIKSPHFRFITTVKKK